MSSTTDFPTVPNEDLLLLSLSTAAVIRFLNAVIRVSFLESIPLMKSSRTFFPADCMSEDASLNALIKLFKPLLPTLVKASPNEPNLSVSTDAVPFAILITFSVSLTTAESVVGLTPLIAS